MADIMDFGEPARPSGDHAAAAEDFSVATPNVSIAVPAGHDDNDGAPGGGGVPDLPVGEDDAALFFAGADDDDDGALADVEAYTATAPPAVRPLRRRHPSLRRRPPRDDNYGNCLAAAPCDAAPCFTGAAFAAATGVSLARLVAVTTTPAAFGCVAMGGAYEAPFDAAAHTPIDPPRHTLDAAAAAADDEAAWRQDAWYACHVGAETVVGDAPNALPTLRVGFRLTRVTEAFVRTVGVDEACTGDDVNRPLLPLAVAHFRHQGRTAAHRVFLCPTEVPILDSDRGVDPGASYLARLDETLAGVPYAWLAAPLAWVLRQWMLVRAADVVADVALEQGDDDADARRTIALCREQHKAARAALAAKNTEFHNARRYAAAVVEAAAQHGAVRRERIVAEMRDRVATLDRVFEEQRAVLELAVSRTQRALANAGAAKKVVPREGVLWAFARLESPVGSRLIPMRLLRRALSVDAVLQRTLSHARVEDRVDRLVCEGTNLPFFAAGGEARDGDDSDDNSIAV